MTAPAPKRRARGWRPGHQGHKQLSTWLTSDCKKALEAAALQEDRPQREILEDALAAYFARRLPEPPPA